jgi:hypothetical protein
LNNWRLLISFIPARLFYIQKGDLEQLNLPGQCLIAATKTHNTANCYKHPAPNY